MEFSIKNSYKIRQLIHEKTYKYDLINVILTKYIIFINR